MDASEKKLEEKVRFGSTSEYITTGRQVADIGYRILDIAESVLVKRENPAKVPEINAYMQKKYSQDFCKWLTEFFDKTYSSDKKESKETSAGDTNGGN